MAVIEVKQDNFKKEILESEGLVMVDFFAEWCGPCKMTGPVIDQLSDEVKDVRFVKVNVDENPELASTYSIFSIPSFVIFKDGQIVSQFTGAMSREGFLAKLNEIRR